MRWLTTKVWAAMFVTPTVALVAAVTLRYVNAQQTYSVSFNVSNAVSSNAYDLKNVQEIRNSTAQIRVLDVAVNESNWVVRTTTPAKLLALNEGQTITAIAYNGQVIHFAVSRASYQGTHEQIALEYKGATAPEGQPKASRQ